MKVKLNETTDHSWLTPGKLYEISKMSAAGNPVIIDDEGDEWTLFHPCDYEFVKDPKAAPHIVDRLREAQENLRDLIKEAAKDHDLSVEFDTFTWGVGGQHTQCFKMKVKLENKSNGLPF